MDTSTASVIVAGIASAGTVAAAAIGAWKDIDRAVGKATEPLRLERGWLREQLIAHGGDPDEYDPEHA